MAQGVVHNGSKTVTTSGTPVPLSATKVMCNWILMHPLAANTGIIYIGGSTVTSTSGVAMGVGNSDVLWPSAGSNMYDLSTIYIDASVSGEGIQFIYTSF